MITFVCIICQILLSIYIIFIKNIWCCNPFTVTACQGNRVTITCSTKKYTRHTHALLIYNSLEIRAAGWSKKLHDAITIWETYPYDNTDDVMTCIITSSKWFIWMFVNINFILLKVSNKAFKMGYPETIINAFLFFFCMCRCLNDC